MLKIYYDRFMETCHNIFKSLIFSFPLFFFSFSSPFSPTFRTIVSFQKQSFAHHFHAIRSPSARCSLVLRSSSARRPRATYVFFVHRPRAVRAPSARPPLVVCAPFIVSTSCPLVLRASSASCPRVLCTPCASCSHVLRAPSASSLRVLRTPFASYLLVLCALRVVRPPYVALSHKTKLKRVPSN